MDRVIQKLKDWKNKSLSQAGKEVLIKAVIQAIPSFLKLHFFSLAMLAKQLWNLMKQPSSLAYRILKAKYFPRTDMLQAGLGHNPSYLWRSILAAKGVVEEGIGWRIGNGRLVNILADRWVGTEDV